MKHPKWPILIMAMIITVISNLKNSLQKNKNNYHQSMILHHEQNNHWQVLSEKRQLYLRRTTGNSLHNTKSLVDNSHLIEKSKT